MFIFKFVLDNDTRRIALDAVPPFNVLLALARNLFGLEQKEFSFHYYDEDRDLIKVASDIELDEALRQSENTQTIKFHIRVTGEAPKPVQAPPQPKAAIPDKNPQLQASLLASSRMRSSQIARELNFLNHLEHHLAYAYRNISIFMRGDLKDKLVNLVHDCNQAVGKVSNNVNQHVFAPITRFTSVHAAPYTNTFRTEIEKLKQEVNKLRGELQKELQKVGDKQQARKDAGQTYFAPLLALQKNTPAQPAAQSAPQPEQAPVEAAQDPLSDHEISKLLQHFQLLSDTPDEDDKAPAGVVPEEYKNSVLALNDMGFMDDQRNVALLQKYAGDLNQVVDAYLN